MRIYHLIEQKLHLSFFNRIKPHASFLAFINRIKSHQLRLPFFDRIEGRQKKITLVLAAVVWLSGSTMLMVASLVTIASHANHSLVYDSRPGPSIGHLVTPAHTGVAISSTATATPAPMPSPFPSPIAPFPGILSQEVAALTARDRFLVHGNLRLPEIALTFDDGPNPPYTSQILAILRQYGVKATFFCVGRQAQAFPKLVQEEFADGHVIGNHSWSHPYMPALSEQSVIWQFTTTSDTLQHITGVRPLFFRPPYGAYNTLTLKYANLYGLTTVIWNVDPQDWSMPGTQRIIARVLSHAHDGAIILMHDGGGNRAQTVAALPVIINTLQERGYHLVTLQQLVEDAHKTSAASAVASRTGATSLLSQLMIWDRRKTA